MYDDATLLLENGVFDMTLKRSGFNSFMLYKLKIRIRPKGYVFFFNVVEFHGGLSPSPSRDHTKLNYVQGKIYEHIFPKQRSITSISIYCVESNGKRKNLNNSLRLLSL